MLWSWLNFFAAVAAVAAASSSFAMPRPLLSL